jgi:hypothetical protein
MKTLTTYQVVTDLNATRRAPEFASMDEAYDYLNACEINSWIMTKLVRDERNNLIASEVVD